MVDALRRVLAVFRKRPLPPEHPDDDPPKKAKLEQHRDGDGAGEAVTGGDDDDDGEQDEAAQLRQRQLEDADAATSPPQPLGGDLPPTDVADEVQQELEHLSQLECPVCVDTMQPPVRQCVNGHCVCNACRARVSACPLCRGPLSALTHARLDPLARTLTLSCAHRPRGCGHRLRVTDRESHLLECAFNACRCPLPPCTWTGAFRAVRQHCLLQHPLSAKAAGTTASFSVELTEDGHLAEGARAVLLGAEVFVVEVHDLPGRSAVLARQLAAGRLRPPPHACELTLRSGARPQPVLRARVPALASEDSVVAAVETGRCLVAAVDALGPLAQDGAVALECTPYPSPGPAAPGWLAWLADMVWSR